MYIEKLCLVNRASRFKTSKHYCKKKNIFDEKKTEGFDIWYLPLTPAKKNIYTTLHRRKPLSYPIKVSYRALGICLILQENKKSFKTFRRLQEFKLDFLIRVLKIKFSAVICLSIGDLPRLIPNTDLFFV